MPSMGPIDALTPPSGGLPNVDRLAIINAGRQAQEDWDWTAARYGGGCVSQVNIVHQLQFVQHRLLEPQLAT